jgi:Rieske Fe-S protein
VNCPYCSRPLTEIDHYGERLVGCKCNRWGNPGDERLVMELTEDELEALKAMSRETGPKEATMGTCVQCGNDYDKSFEVRMNGRTMIFDSFECAIQALAPVCPHCGCRIIGHGVQHGDTIFCCVHCAKHEGVEGLRDRD